MPAEQPASSSGEPAAWVAAAHVAGGSQPGPGLSGERRRGEPWGGERSAAGHLACRAAPEGFQQSPLHTPSGAGSRLLLRLLLPVHLGREGAESWPWEWRSCDFDPILKAPPSLPLGPLAPEMAEQTEPAVITPAMLEEEEQLEAAGLERERKMLEEVRAP